MTNSRRIWTEIYCQRLVAMFSDPVMAMLAEWSEDDEQVDEHAAETHELENEFAALLGQMQNLDTVVADASSVAELFKAEFPALQQRSPRGGSARASPEPASCLPVTEPHEHVQLLPPSRPAPSPPVTVRPKVSPEKALSAALEQLRLNRALLSTASDQLKRTRQAELHNKEHFERLLHSAESKRRAESAEMTARNERLSQALETAQARAARVTEDLKQTRALLKSTQLVCETQQKQLQTLRQLVHSDPPTEKPSDIASTDSQAARIRELLQEREDLRERLKNQEERLRRLAP